MPVSYDAATPIIAGFLLDLHFNIPTQSVCHIDAVQCRFLNDRPSFLAEDEEGDIVDATAAVIKG